jgi:hypothetical protein
MQAAAKKVASNPATRNLREFDVAPVMGVCSPLGVVLSDISEIHPVALKGPIVAKHFERGQQQNLYVQENRPVSQVFQVIFNTCLHILDA